MNNYIERYAIENAQHDANILTAGTGIEHIVKTIRNGVLVAIPVDVEPFLTSEQIPADAINKPVPPKSGSNQEGGFTFSNGDDLAVKAKAPNYLINNILETDAHGILGGSSMAFKTFVIIRLAHSICTGKSFMGHDVFYSGKVLMACGEGQGALSRRIKAVQIVDGDFNGNLMVLNEAVRIDNKADMARLRCAFHL